MNTDKLINYNKVLDLLSQCELILLNDFAPKLIVDQLQICKALVFHELKIVEADIKDVKW